MNVTSGSGPSRDSGAVGGFLNINKGPGLTSTDVVRRVKRLTGQRKVGHGGTLDPDATGVLPVCLGIATRFVEAIIDGGKSYSVTVRLGAATDTYDASGQVTRESDASHITRADVEAVLGRFRGRIEQVPPMYSALKLGGRPLYEIARAGGTVERAPRRVDVHRLELVQWSPPDFQVEVDCGRGFYARSLANDIGEELQNAAHMLTLERRRAGPFRIEDAITLDALERMVKLGNWEQALYAPDFVLEDLPKVVLDPVGEEMICHGQAVPATGRTVVAATAGALARMYSTEGRFLALARYDVAGPWWRPEKVVAPA
ncbi:MAG: tRNA pseudouridine(55) synthase TruB [Chloroflexi bacterium]|nr:tRNA pseudouridine(55) synthase TruB [Chloroflexota bacterium]